MEIKETSLRLAAVSLIADEAKKAKDKLRAELKEEMDKIGADRVKAELGDETVAYVTTTKPKFKWRVKSERQFVEWVKEHHPSEIVESVRESSRDAILSKFHYKDLDFIISPYGEIIEFLEGDETEPYLVTKFHGEGRDKLKDALVNNIIEAKRVLELD